MHDSPWYRQMLRPRGWLLVWAPIFLITAAHFATDNSAYWIHDILRRVYYIPIILAAFMYGRPGALAASVTASVCYAPHAFAAFTHLHHDPAQSTEKLLEILLYNVIAFITGTLADHEKREKEKQAHISAQLQDTLEEMRALDEQLVRSGRLQALGELTAGLAHEIKNPLASIRGASEIIGDEIPADSPYRKMVEIQQKELERLSGLVERFLAFARPKEFEFTAFDICPVVQECVILMEPQAWKNHISISVNHLHGSQMIRADKEKIIQVIINILLNAIEMTFSDGTILVESDHVKRGKKRYTVIRIIDNGPGVPFDIREKIFNPFFSTKHTGAGLGLAIASRIIDEHGGFIEVTDQDQGACFSVFLVSSQSS